MASNKEFSNTKNVIRIPANKNKPPDNIPTTPKTPKNSQQLPHSYTDTGHLEKTPKQTVLGKRPNENPNAGPSPRPPPVRNPITPRRASLPPIPLSHPTIQPLILRPEDSDHVMQDPFVQPASKTLPQPEEEKDEDERFFDCLYKTMDLLKEVHTELKTARNENFLTDILRNPQVEGYLEELASLIPNPVLAGITQIRKMVEDLTDKNNKAEWTAAANPSDRTLHGSAHTAENSSLEPDRPPRSFSNVLKNANHPPQINQYHKSTSTATKAKTTPSNPNAAHHPSRLIAQFLPTGIPENLRPDPSKIVSELNAAISKKHQSNPVKIVAANFNMQGNLIISTRSDQTANELLRYRDSILPALSIIGNTQHIELREDKKWFKIQIDAVNTSYISIGNERVPLSAEAVHEELLACNPQYANMADSIVSKPRWLRAKEELLTTLRSSLVFATTDEAAARSLLKYRSLAAFGRHCSTRAFQDRPPITQCRNCWRLDHTSHQCKEDQRCRICSGRHDEKEHQHADPTNCNRCILANELGDTMDTSAEGLCPHDIRCVNCLGKENVEHDHPADARRCPTRLERYGTARENEKRAAKSDNPWLKAKPNNKKHKPKSTLGDPPSKPTTNSSANRFNPLDTATSQRPTLESTQPNMYHQ